MLDRTVGFIEWYLSTSNPKTANSLDEMVGILAGAAEGNHGVGSPLIEGISYGLAASVVMYNTPTLDELRNWAGVTWPTHPTR